MLPSDGAPGGSLVLERLVSSSLPLDDQLGQAAYGHVPPAHVGSPAHSARLSVVSENRTEAAA